MTALTQFKMGEVLFHQGDASNRVLRVHSGKIEILREVGNAAVVLGEVQGGEWLGEMGVLENRDRSATARAVTDGTLEVLDAPAFLERVCNDSELARDLILRLSVRLKSVEDKIAAGLLPFAQKPSAAGPVADAQEASIMLTAGTEALQARIGAAPIAVTRLPFVVGRVPAAGKNPSPRPPDLLIDDHEPFRLSRSHFMISRQHGAVVVADLHSALGTVVNGQAIGTHFPRDVALLRTGENLVVAGGRGSPFEFTIVLG